MRAGIQTQRTSHESGPGNKTNSPPKLFSPLLSRRRAGLCNGNSVFVFLFFLFVFVNRAKVLHVSSQSHGKGREEEVGIKAG